MSVFACPGLSPERTPSQCRHRGRLGAAAVATLVLTAGAVVAPLAVPVASAQPPRTCSTSAATHTVEPGDTWFGIARAAAVSATSLYAANDASADSPIYPGDVLCLPAGATDRSPGTTPSASSAPGRSCPTSLTYTVVSGDTWSQIAARAGASIASVLEVNSATTASVIHPGDSLCMPAGATAPTTGSGSRRGSTGMQALPAQGPCWFSDTWHAPRGNGRRHEGVDLIAFAGSYVYAVTDGTLTRRAWDQPGSRSGNAWWLTSADGSGTYYFYAHLSGFAQGLHEGSKVRAGEIIGLVGSTGNSATAHLHLEIHPGGGAAVDPYPALKAMGGCKAGDAYEQPGGWTPATGHG